jgi:hypothetical protein
MFGMACGSTAAERPECRLGGRGPVFGAGWPGWAASSFPDS